MKPYRVRSTDPATWSTTSLYNQSAYNQHDSKKGQSISEDVHVVPFSFAQSKTVHYIFLFYQKYVKYVKNKFISKINKRHWITVHFTKNFKSKHENKFLAKKMYTYNKIPRKRKCA